MSAFFRICTALWWLTLIWVVGFTTCTWGWRAWPVWVWCGFLGALEIRDQRRYRHGGRLE